MKRLTRVVRPPFLFVLLAVAAAVVVAVWRSGGDGPERLGLADFERAVAAGEVATAEVGDRSRTVTGELSDGTGYRTEYASEYADELTAKLLAAGVDVVVDHQRPNPWTSFLVGMAPTVLFLGVILWFLMSMQSGRGALSMGKSKARQVAKDQPKVTFADVAGCDEAVEELQELKEFLRDPSRFGAIGARIPKGVLLFGPPGTGKTLLARAVAGEAGVPFFSISGSDFVEVFVGVGAARVRSLFEQAKAAAPAIVFVDEIDAVGRHRGAGLGGGHDEREQTLNQLLVEMDGFDVRSGVIVIAATNRPDILDPALLRPGRFDRHITIEAPDLSGRRAILRVHAADKPLAPEVDLDVLARRTPGFTGADLANVLNEAALLAARRARARVENVDLSDAVERVIAGPERRSKVMSDTDKRRVAYHEAGHALVGHVLAGCDPIHKVSIVARGRALGWTLALPVEDRVLRTRSELRDQLAMLLAGRCAEELVFAEVSTGAADDIERATRIARAMVTEWGMSDVLGPQQLAHTSGEVFLGKEVGHQATTSDIVAARVDAEVQALIDGARTAAAGLLATHRSVLDRLCEALIERETVEEQLLDAILAGAGGGPAAGRAVG